MLGLFFDMLSMGVCTTRQRQTLGRLVQELNGCIVHMTACYLSFLGVYRYNQSAADVWSTGVGIKYLYCTYDSL